ncbi:prohead protease/major capsid protein fusion protein [Bradyrhizobium sp. 195]|uniref:prohead protease/major capsid protein fusion protein n=1 Tax=Bradyrhizobium sp. 195 TaxID=2782662 RepID=UPI00200166E2|nr:prohead protease/major capsid protein fusion protein [Bradyrhizobium sp. 195]UPK25941.1 Mu-like prophage major head subunit gpT family protein [Bradyrhizobium sp. 195]
MTDLTGRRSPARTDLHVRDIQKDPPALPMQTRELPVGSVDTQKRTVKVVFTTGAAVKRRRWAGWDTAVPFEEILEVSRSAINLDRLNAGAPALDSHSAYSTSAQVGVVERAWIEGGEGRALIRFPREGLDANADRMFALVSDGIIRNVSVGYAIDEVRVVEPQKKGEVEKRIITRWTPFEVSFVTIPADAGAQVRGAEETFPVVISRATQHTVRNMKGSTSMDIHEANQNDDDAVVASRSDENNHQGDRRALEFYEMAAQRGLPAEFARKHIGAGSTMKAFRLAILDEMAAAGSRANISSRSGDGASATLDNPDFLARSIEDAIVARMSGKRPEGAAMELMGRTVLDMGAMLVQARGERPIWNNRDRLLTQVMQRSGGMQSTSDLPILLTSAGNRVLNDAYRVAQTPLINIAKRREAVDFRALTTIKLSEAPRLSEVKEGGEVTHGARSEAKESFKLKTYAKIFALSRQAIINDDLGAFADSNAAFGRAAAQTEADVLVSLLTANSGNGVNLDDGSPLYGTGASRGNKAAAGGAISASTLDAARQALRGMKDIDGKTAINVTPKHLVVGPAKETEAEQFLATTLYPNQPSGVNPFAGKLTLSVDPRLSGNAWRLFADPTEVATILVAYLNGADGPIVETRLGWDVLGVEVRAVLDFGCGVNDFRGTYLNPGN